VKCSPTAIAPWRALQAVTEEVVLHVARHLATTYPSRNLVLTGGKAF
jgi:predicted NodU family carbamoyl transferase